MLLCYLYIILHNICSYVRCNTCLETFIADFAVNLASHVNIYIAVFFYFMYCVLYFHRILSVPF